jgi:SAM-dependent methyltransferase
MDVVGVFGGAPVEGRRAGVGRRAPGRGRSTRQLVLARRSLHSTHVDADDAVALVASAVPGPGIWADLGAGRGTFSRALATLLGPRGHVFALDREPSSVAALSRPRAGPDTAAPVTPLLADFTDATAWPSLGLPPLDGVLLANALHFVPADEQGAVLASLVTRLRPRGRLVLVEYEGRPPSRWVPHPVSLARLAAIAPAGVTPPARVGMRRSAYGGWMYAAVCERRSAA